MTRTLYAAPQLPDRWIAEDDAGDLVMFPTRSDGWRDRVAYKGHRRALREVPASNAIGTGWPGVPQGRPARAGEAAPVRISVRCTADEKTRWEQAAGREGQDLSAWLRAAAELAIARGSTR